MFTRDAVDKCSLPLAAAIFSKQMAEELKGGNHEPFNRKSGECRYRDGSSISRAIILCVGAGVGQTSMSLNARSAGAITRPDNPPRDYFDGIDQNNPLMSTGEFPDVLSQFSPTLVVTGTRDIAMGNALMAHATLLRVDVRAELFVQEGLGPGHFFTFPGTQESDITYNVIWDFFDRTLGR